MPIKPENKSRYPKNWKQISEDIRFNRAKNRCEVCGVHNYSVGYREGNKFIPTCGNLIHDAAGMGELSYKEARELADHSSEVLDEKYIVIVLTVAHLDHQPENCDYSNLLAMCQMCHNNYDKAHRKATFRNSKTVGQYVLPLF